MSTDAAKNKLNRMLRYGEKISQNDILDADYQEHRTKALTSYAKRWEELKAKAGEQS